MAYYKSYRDGRKVWEDIPGSIYIECCYNDNGLLCNCDNDKELPESINDEIAMLYLEENLIDDSNFAIEIEIRFLCNGGYDPGKRFDAPENCYPPEYDDERLLSGVFVHYHKINTEGPSEIIKKEVSHVVACDLFGFFEKDVIREYINYADYGD